MEYRWSAEEATEAARATPPAAALRAVIDSPGSSRAASLLLAVELSAVVALALVAAALRAADVYVRVVMAQLDHAYVVARPLPLRLRPQSRRTAPCIDL